MLATAWLVVVQRFTGFPWSVRINPHGSGRKWSADRLIKKKLCVHVISACLKDNSGINNIIKYRSEIQFLLCFIWRSVNPIET
jgi:hypothetical protein